MLADVVVLFVGSVWTLGVVRLTVSRPGLRRLVGWPQLVAGAAAITVLALALSPPVDVPADGSLWVHMVQHLLIGLVAPLLWCASRPLLVLSSVLDPPARRSLDRRVATVRHRYGLRAHAAAWSLGAVSVHVAVWWGWHTPALFDLALRVGAVHAVEHACLFAAGAVLWWVCLGVRWDDRAGLAVLVLFGAAVGTGIVGALLTIAPTPIYATTVSGVQRWGLTRLSDQQLGGVIMWVVGGAVYLVVASAVVVRWLTLGPAPGESTTETRFRPRLQ